MFTTANTHFERTVKLAPRPDGRRRFAVGRKTYTDVTDLVLRENVEDGPANIDEVDDGLLLDEFRSTLAPLQRDCLDAFQAGTTPAEYGRDRDIDLSVATRRFKRIAEKFVQWRASRD